MIITTLIIFVALYCWLGRAWRKDKQFREGLNKCIARFVNKAMSRTLFAYLLESTGLNLIEVVGEGQEMRGTTKTKLPEMKEGGAVFVI